jgi:L-ascorbate oxidase
MTRSDHEIWNPTIQRFDKVTLRTYNDCLTGPTLTLAPGERLKINLVNQLGADPKSVCPNPIIVNDPNCFNSGNLHTHGLHVSPAGNGDNVLVSVEPGQSFPYEYNIPLDHPSGTFWYHSHRHGSTAISVSSGMEGVLIVKGHRRYEDRAANHNVVDIDTILHTAPPEPKDFGERLMLFQQIVYGCFTDATYTKLKTDASGAWTCDPNEKAVVENYPLQLNVGSWPDSGRFTAVNGKVQPIMEARAGEIERWRLVHGGIRDTINFRVAKASTVPAAPAGPGASVSLRAFTANDVATTASVQALVGHLQALRGAELQTFVQQSCGGAADPVTSQYEIAADGLTRTNVTPKDVNVLNPGQRSDVLVVYPSEGVYCILDEAAPAEALINRGSGGLGSKNRQLLALVVVKGGTPVPGPSDQTIKDALRNADPTLPQIIRDGFGNFDISAFAFKLQGANSDLRTAAVTGHPTALFDLLLPVGDSSAPAGQSIRGFVENTAVAPDPQQYDHDKSYVAVLNTVDEWTLGVVGPRNVDGGTNIPAPHVFHIHVNPFQILDITHNGQSIFDPITHGCLPAFRNRTNPDGSRNRLYSPELCDQYDVFRDTLLVKPNFTVRARMRYDDYIGEYVMHCHILDHEDQGMMQNVTIVSSLRQEPAATLVPLQSHHHQ